ncbi:hypothetical protein DM01DRAFT_1014688 [Hesseltinella vesiculosa]|uniref:Uncharacterized protein n=1 Tax=Hesseltinella vesiculosa TaxID=101127 RepID=A0A1X2GLU2_9FUNG|nr:hypothetical protein DM01DRAFT_1014688 [Hesseltinella vesiculosa]
MVYLHTKIHAHWLPTLPIFFLFANFTSLNRLNRWKKTLLPDLPVIRSVSFF